MLVSGGFTYSEIERQFEDTAHPAPRRSVSNHSKYCLNYEDEAIRRMVEKHAEERGINVETATQRLIQNKSYLQLTVEKGFEALVDSNIAPEPKDVYKAIELLDKLEDKGINWTIERIERQYQAMAQAVKEIVPDHLLPGIIERARNIYEGEIEDAEVVQDSNATDRKGNPQLPNPDEIPAPGTKSGVPGPVDD